MSDDQRKINKDIRDDAIRILVDQTSDLGLPFTMEDDQFIVSLPPLDDRAEDPGLD